MKMPEFIESISQPNPRQHVYLPYILKQNKLNRMGGGKGICLHACIFSLFWGIWSREKHEENDRKRVEKHERYASKKGSYISRKLR